MQKRKLNVLQREEKKYSIILRNDAIKSLERIPLIWQERIKRTIDALEYNPYVGEKMSGNFCGSFKIKVWPYRIIFTIIEEKREVYIYKIAHRQSVYKI